MRRNYQTQWAGQFGVAHELIRRGYLVSFTTGNAPADDLLCSSPSGTPFTVQVKSLGAKGFFLYQTSLLQSKSTRYFVFVLVPKDASQRPEYFVLSTEQFRKLDAEQQRSLVESEKKRGKPYAKFSRGIHYLILARHNFRDAWGDLPK